MSIKNSGTPATQLHPRCVTQPQWIAMEKIMNIAHFARRFTRSWIAGLMLVTVLVLSSQSPAAAGSQSPSDPDTIVSNTGAVIAPAKLNLAAAGATAKPQQGTGASPSQSQQGSDLADLAGAAQLPPAADRAADADASK